MNIIIKGFIETSMLDWEGMIVSTLYAPRCNFRCPYCQNSGLVLNPEQLEEISLDSIKKYLIKQKGWVDGICLTGGEPCLYSDLEDFIREIRELGMKVKLDTNGTFPGYLKKLLDLRIVDYVAMDIKAPLDLEAYGESAGIKNEGLLNKVKESIKVIMSSTVDYEFRTTVVPKLHKTEDIKNIARYIKGAKKYALQNFKPQETLDPSYLDEKPYNPEQLKEICDSASKYVEKCIARGV